MALPTISAVLPFSDRETVRRNWDRMLLCLRSLDYFWIDSAPLDIALVTPDDEYDGVRTRFGRLSAPRGLSIRILNESAISPMIAAAPPVHGVAKQMLVKLGANRTGRSDFFLTLDSDLVACKPMDRASLIEDGRALTDYFSYGEHPWYRNSAKVLGYEARTYSLDRPRLFVTPAILSATILEKLQRELSSRGSPLRRAWLKASGWNSSWIGVLLDHFQPIDNAYWTEYTLYDLFAERSGDFEKHHQPAGRAHRLHCMQQSLWAAHHWDAWDPVKAFDSSGDGFFMVLQSILANEISFDDVERRVVVAASEVHPDFAAFYARSFVEAPP